MTRSVNARMGIELNKKRPIQPVHHSGPLHSLERNLAEYGDSHMADALAPTLNSLERSKLRTCEAVIQRHVAAFVEMGNALATIRDERLYRETHKSFEAYLRDRWQLERTYAHRLIEAAKVTQAIAEAATEESVARGQQIPTSERVARPLTALPEEQQPQAWAAAQERAAEAGVPITAEIVEQAVEEIQQPAAGQPPAYTCSNCGSHECDEDGDCAVCHEPAVVPAASNGRPPSREATAADTAKAQIQSWIAAVDNWLQRSPSIDDLRRQHPGQHGDRVVTLASQLSEALKNWKGRIR